MRKLKLAVPTKRAMLCGEIRPHPDSKPARTDFAAKEMAANKQPADE